MLNILFVSGKSVYSTKHFGGAETSMHVLAEAFARQNHKVYYFSISKKRSISYCLNKVHVYLHKPLRLPWLPKKMKAHIKQQQQQKALGKVIAHNRIDVVYVFGKIMHQLIAIRNKKALKFKIVQRFAGINTPSQSLKGLSSPNGVRALEFLNEVDGYNFQSENHRASYLKVLTNSGLQLTLKKELIHDIGIHPDFFNSARKKTPDADDCRLACVMRFSERKRQDLIIEALASPKIAHVKITFFGDGPMKETLKNKAKELGLEKQIHFESFLERNELIGQLNTYDALLHPVDYEPRSKAVWEAMALQLPVVCSNVESLNSYIKHGENGLLVNNTSLDWRKIIQKLARRDIQLNALANKAHTLVKQEAYPDKNITRFETFFNELVDNE